MELLSCNGFLADVSSVTSNMFPAGFGVCVRFHMVAFGLESWVTYMTFGKPAVQS